MYFLSYPDGTLEILQKAENLAQELEDNKSHAKIYSNLGFYHSCKGDPLLGIEYSEKCFNLAEKIGEIVLMGRSAIDISSSNLLAGNYIKAADIGLRALNLLEEHHKEKDYLGKWINLYSSLSGWSGMALGFLGYFDKGKNVLNKGRQIAFDVNDRYGIGWVELCNSYLSFWEGDGNNTRDHAQKAVIGHEESGAAMNLGTAWSMLGAGYYLLEELATARTDAEKGLKLQKDIGVPVMLPVINLTLALIYSKEGNIDAAKSCAEDSLKLAQKFNNKTFEGLALIILGCIIGKTDTISYSNIALEKIKKGFTVLNERGVRSYIAFGHIYQGEFLADVGMKEKAAENLKRAESMYLEMKVTPKSYWLARIRDALVKLNQ